MDKWRSFAQDPFGYVDQLSLKVRGNELNPFLKINRFQKVTLYGAIAFTVLWILQGFDSSPLQLIIPLYEKLPGVLAGQLHWSSMVDSYNYYYGKEMHYSALVIYFLLWHFASKNFLKAGIDKSKNFVYSFSVMFLAIAAFEWFWIYSFGFFQSQPWVYTWMFPQERILIQNLSFTIAGALGIFYMWVMSFNLKGSGRSAEYLGRFYMFRLKEVLPWLMVSASAAVALFWIYYPFPVDQITVTLDNGQLWTSSRLFPQTLYTVALDPGIINAGSWYYVQNDAVHLVNTIAKVIWAAAVYLLFRVKRVDG